MFEETRKYMKKLGLPEGDLYDLPTSSQRFGDGTHFRIEVPTINSAEAVGALLDTADKNGITINRITETYGMFRHTRQEIKEYCRLCHDYGCELLMSVGPRATYDTGATVLSPQGIRISYRLRGMEQLLRAIEDVKRGIELGVRGFLIYDEGMLWVVGQMRKDGELPKGIVFKTSAHLGQCNPASFKLLESLGADSINPVRDLAVGMHAALRAAVKAHLDIHTDNPPASGGFIRVYEAADIVRVAAPVHLKTGNSVVGAHGQITSASDGRKMADQASIVVEMVNKYYPEAKQTQRGSSDLMVPVI
ncbi:MAG TPA: peptidase [Anaerolineae bacterium]|nr:peptidase [Anaerolineae bacterium]HPL29043.1 peptidase [Anaerolineae bacterium]